MFTKDELILIQMLVEDEIKVREERFKHLQNEKIKKLARNRLDELNKILDKSKIYIKTAKWEEE